MESEIREQALVLEVNTDRYYAELTPFLKDRDFELVVIAARGSSDHAALYLRYLIEIHLQIPVSLAAPSVITRFHSKIKYPRSLGIGISQSGAGPDVAGVLEYLQSEGHETLAVTNTVNSNLGKVSQHTLKLGAGPERSVAATKSYTASLLAAYQIARAMGADLPDPRGNLPTNEWVNQCQEVAQADLGAILRSTTLISLARGYSYCTALETSLKMMECALLPCKGYSTADFQHGPKALAGHGSAAIVFGDSPEDLTDYGCVGLYAPEAPDNALTPIWDAMFAQWLALLAARARGLDPDHPRSLKKITQTL
ncbi:MAG: SIS domain-containing protein [Armatimonadetes bacterium]|nr:SIS domain-containing protein [Armatimonadota bacterium]